MIKLKRLLLEQSANVLSDNWFDELYIKLKKASVQMKLNKDPNNLTKLGLSGITFASQTKKINPAGMSFANMPSAQDAPTVKPIEPDFSSLGFKKTTNSYKETSQSSMMYYGMWVIWRDVNKPITFGKLDGSGHVVKFTLTSGTLVKESTTGIDYDLVKLIKSTTNLINNKKAPIWSLVAWLRKDSLEIWNTQWSSLFKQAKQWWIERLSSEDFEMKIRKIRGWSKDKFRSYLQSYIKVIAKTPIKAADGRWQKERISDANGVNFSPYNNPDKEPGYFSLLPNTRIYINTMHVYKDSGNGNIGIGSFGFYENDVVNITIHELQHSLWAYLPFNPAVNWKKVFKTDIHMGTAEEKALYTNDDWWSKKNVLLKKSGDIDHLKIDNRKKDLIEKYGTEYNLTNNHLNQWLDPKNSAGTFKKPTKDDWYGANANEHASRLEQFKQAKGLSILDNITVQHIIDTIKLGSYENRRDKKTGKTIPESYLVPVVRGWVRNGMPDIQEWTNSLNTFLLVKQEKDKYIQQQKNKKYGDFTQSA